MSVNGEEQTVNDGASEFVINADTVIGATFEAVPVAIDSKEIAAADADEDEEEDEVMFDGHNVIRFNKSFTAKLIQIDEVSNAWYTD